MGVVKHEHGVDAARVKVPDNLRPDSKEAVDLIQTRKPQSMRGAASQPLRFALGRRPSMPDRICQETPDWRGIGWLFSRAASFNRGLKMNWPVRHIDGAWLGVAFVLPATWIGNDSMHPLSRTSGNGHHQRPLRSSRSRLASAIHTRAINIFLEAIIKLSMRTRTATQAAHHSACHRQLRPYSSHAMLAAVRMAMILKA
jgi:hypothetical protein